MMTTVNLSLSKSQLSLIDSLTATYGFTNRSEFIRSLLRLLRIKPEILEEAAVFPFVAPPEKSAKKVIAAFAKTNKYSKELLKDLKEGLANSDYFTS